MLARSSHVERVTFPSENLTSLSALPRHRMLRPVLSLCPGMRGAGVEREAEKGTDMSLVRSRNKHTDIVPKKVSSIRGRPERKRMLGFGGIGCPMEPLSTREDDL